MMLFHYFGTLMLFATLATRAFDDGGGHAYIVQTGGAVIHVNETAAQAQAMIANPLPIRR